MPGPVKDIRIQQILDLDLNHFNRFYLTWDIQIYSARTARGAELLQVNISGLSVSGSSEVDGHWREPGSEKQKKKAAIFLRLHLHLKLFDSSCVAVGVFKVQLFLELCRDL